MDQYTVHPLTKLSHKKGLRMTQVDQSWGLFDHHFFNATGEDHFLELKILLGFAGYLLVGGSAPGSKSIRDLDLDLLLAEPRGHVYEKEEGIESARKNCLAILWVLLVLICPVCSQKVSLIIFTCCFNISFCLNTCESCFSYFLTIANKTQHVKQKKVSVLG